MSFSLVMRRGASGFSVLRFWLYFKSVIRFLCQKTSAFRFWGSLRFTHLPYFGIWFSLSAKTIDGFSDLILDAVFGFSYGFRFLFDLSGNYAPPQISNSG